MRRRARHQVLPVCWCPKGSQQGKGCHYHLHESRELKFRRSLQLGRVLVLYFNHRLSLLCGSQHGPCLASQGAVPRALHPYLPCLSLHPGWDGPPTVPGREGKYLHPRCQFPFLSPPGVTAAAPGHLPGSGVQSAPAPARPSTEPRD